MLMCSFEVLKIIEYLFGINMIGMAYLVIKKFATHIVQHPLITLYFFIWAFVNYLIEMSLRHI